MWFWTLVFFSSDTHSFFRQFLMPTKLWFNEKGAVLIIIASLYCRKVGHAIKSGNSYNIKPVQKSSWGVSFSSILKSHYWVIQTYSSPIHTHTHAHTPADGRLAHSQEWPCTPPTPPPHPTNTLQLGQATADLCHSTQATNAAINQYCTGI